jgi:hypothetical protein
MSATPCCATERYVFDADRAPDAGKARTSATISREPEIVSLRTAEGIPVLGPADTSENVKAR